MGNDRIFLGRKIVQVTDGLEIESRLFGQEFYVESRTGLPDAVQKVQEAGLVQVPTYTLIGARGSAPKEDPLWSKWHDTLGERLTLEQDGNLYVVDLQGAGLFMPCPNDVKSAIDEDRLVNGAMSISAEKKQMLLNRHQAYRWNGSELEIVSVQFFSSYADFLTASKTPAFQNALENMTAVYAVVRSANDAQRNPSEYRSLDSQKDNPDLVIPAGGVDRLKGMLDRAQSFEYAKMGSYHDGYSNQDLGRVVFLNLGNGGVNCEGSLNYANLGRSVGVAPEALKARSAARENTLDAAIKSAVDSGRAFTSNGTLYIPARENCGVSYK